VEIIPDCDHFYNGREAAVGKSSPRGCRVRCIWDPQSRRIAVAQEECHETSLVKRVRDRAYRIAPGCNGPDLSNQADQDRHTLSAGNTMDIMTRLIGPKMTERLGQPIVAENRPGASGMLGLDSSPRRRRTVTSSPRDRAAI